jgi:hypothetical protein
MCEFVEISKSIAPILAAISAVAAAVAAFNANRIARSLMRFQRNSFLNARELNLLNRSLELLKIYEVWCTDSGAGSDVNFHDSKETSYESRDDAWSQIPRDIKFLLIQLSSHSNRLEQLLIEWEKDFLEKKGDSYVLKDEQVKEKIKSLRELVLGGL